MRIPGCKSLIAPLPASTCNFQCRFCGQNPTSATALLASPHMLAERLPKLWVLEGLSAHDALNSGEIARTTYATLQSKNRLLAIM